MLNDCPMPDMHAVKHSDRQVQWAGQRRETGDGAKAIHHRFETCRDARAHFLVIAPA